MVLTPTNLEPWFQRRLSQNLRELLVGSFHNHRRAGVMVRKLTKPEERAWMCLIYPRLLKLPVSQSAVLFCARITEHTESENLWCTHTARGFFHLSIQLRQNHSTWCQRYISFWHEYPLRSCGSISWPWPQKPSLRTKSNGWIFFLFWTNFCDWDCEIREVLIHKDRRCTGVALCVRIPQEMTSLCDQLL